MIVNWLGKEATQIFTSVEAQVNSTEEVFQVLEKVFRPESNQTLARFKFRNLKQKGSQTCDGYMSELRLALLECKYRNDADELLKDQFIFRIHNKEIQDHLLGEIKETDNSVRALYEARKIELKLAQRQMLGIVNPNVVSMDAVKIDMSYKYMIVIIVDIPMERVSVQLMEKYATDVVRKTTLRRKCRQRSNRSSGGSKENCDSRRSDKTKRNRCMHMCNVHEIHDDCHSDNDNAVDNLTEQVQSLFY